MERAMEKSEHQNPSVELDILSLPTEILLYILQFLTEARDRVKLLHVSRRLRSIAEAPSLWRVFMWSYYNCHEKDHLFGLMKKFGKHVERLSFPQHVKLSRPAVKNVPHLAAAKSMHGLVSRSQTTFFLLYWGGKKRVWNTEQQLLVQLIQCKRKNSGLATRDYARTS